MDTKVFKKLIKEAVKEAMQEELKEVLLEAIKAPRVMSSAEYNTTPLRENTSIPSGTSRQSYKDLMNSIESDMKTFRFDSSNVADFGASRTPQYTAPSNYNTAGEGSSLPPGEVNLNQIMNLIGKK